MLRLTTSIPTPRPDTSVTSLAVENPASKISGHYVLVRRIGCEHDAALGGAGPDPLDVQPAAVVDHLDHDVAAALAGAQVDDADRRLARSQPGLGCLHSMVDGVAHQVVQRIGNLLDQAAVELSAFTGHAQFDPFAEAGRQLPHQPGETREHVRDRQHPDREHCFLQVAGVARQVGQPRVVDVVAAGAGLGQRALAGQHRLGDHQFAHQVDEQVDLLGGDPDEGRVRDRGVGQRFGTAAAALAGQSRGAGVPRFASSFRRLRPGALAPQFLRGDEQVDPSGGLRAVPLRYGRRVVRSGGLLRLTAAQLELRGIDEELVVLVRCGRRSRRGGRVRRRWRRRLGSGQLRLLVHRGVDGDLLRRHHQRQHALQVRGSALQADVEAHGTAGDVVDHRVVDAAHLG
jgi:hypothetical protein